MSASIRGNSTLLKFYKNNGEVQIANVTQFSFQQNASMTQSMYVGKSLPEGDVAYTGWAGSLQCEVKDSSMDDFMDQVIAQNLSGVGIEEITILYTEFYTNGTQKSYVFSDVQLKAGSTNVGNMTAKVTKSLEFQASLRTPL